MVLWVDKYRPKTLDGLDYHKPLSGQLKRLVAGGDFPHMMIYGPSGAGKKTRIMALLRELHGPSAEKLKVESRTFKVNTTTVELTLLSSPHHIELNPSDAGNRDREVVQEIIKEIAQTAPVLGGGTDGQRGFKVVVLNEVERLSERDFARPPPVPRERPALRAGRFRLPASGSRPARPSAAQASRRSTRSVARWRSTSPPAGYCSAAPTRARWVSPG